MHQGTNLICHYMVNVNLQINMYTYRIKGGCGSTSVKVHLEDEVFNLQFYDKWMGSSELTFELSGSYINKEQSNYYLLQIKKVKIGEDVLQKDKPILTIEFIKLMHTETINMEHYDHIVDGMIMGCCSFNIKSQFNAIIPPNPILAPLLEQYTNVTDLKDLLSKHHLTLEKFVKMVTDLKLLSES